MHGAESAGAEAEKAGDSAGAAAAAPLGEQAAEVEVAGEWARWGQRTVVDGGWDSG